MVLHTHGKTFRVGGGGAFYDKDCWLACLASSEFLDCVVSCRIKNCVSSFRPTIVSPSSDLSDRFSLSHPFPLLFPTFRDLTGWKKGGGGGNNSFVFPEEAPPLFPLPVLLRRLCVFSSRPFLLKRRKRKKLGGENCTAVGLGEDFSASPSFLPILRFPLFCLFRVLFSFSFPSVLLSFYIFSADFVPRLPFILARGTRGRGDPPQTDPAWFS